MIQLITSFYKDKSAIRNGEIMFCIEQNLYAGLDKIIFFCESKEDADFIENYINMIEGLKIGSVCPLRVFIISDNRATYNQFIDIAELSGEDDITVISNTDIFFNSSDISHIKKFYEQENQKHTALALSRWDWQANGQHQLYDRPDSQDTWIFYGKPKGRTSIEFTLGTAGCDNRFAHELEQMGYIVANPSKTIKTFHLHASSIRNYIEDGKPKETVPPPYKLIHPNE